MTDAREHDERSHPVDPGDDNSDGGDLTAPEPGLADPSAQIEAERGEVKRDTGPGHDEPPSDDERTHEADFASGGYDDRQTDGLPKLPGD